MAQILHFLVDLLQLLWVVVQAHPWLLVAVVTWLVGWLPAKNVYFAWLAKLAVQYALQWEHNQKAKGGKPDNVEVLREALKFLRERGVKVPGALRTVIEARVWEVKRAPGGVLGQVLKALPMPNSADPGTFPLPATAPATFDAERARAIIQEQIDLAKAAGIGNLRELIPTQE